MSRATKYVQSFIKVGGWVKPLGRYKGPVSFFNKPVYIVENGQRIEIPLEELVGAVSIVLLDPELATQNDLNFLQWEDDVADMEREVRQAERKFILKQQRC